MEIKNKFYKKKQIQATRSDLVFYKIKLNTMDNQMIKLEVSIDQTNKILKALGRMPYEEVYRLVDMLQNQASNQLQKMEQAKPQQPVTPKTN